MNERHAYNDESIEVVLGKRIRALRESEGISLRDFALMVGISYPYQSQIENGKKSATINRLYRIAQGLGVSLSELFEGVQVEYGGGSRRTCGK